MSFVGSYLVWTFLFVQGKFIQSLHLEKAGKLQHPKNAISRQGTRDTEQRLLISRWIRKWLNSHIDSPPPVPYPR